MGMEGLDVTKLPEAHVKMLSVLQHWVYTLRHILPHLL